ncbi:HlyD family type I secretion periplasmic adaptor subunit [Telluria beijingensis]|uniref:HlyD family type I secretion periplasmic adaptor subunit n=1 Tax=Telluria beijingensis TaxID=3068633 RepID=UPI0027954186|nr:HlyD family type I secretion periplasmic adaptor subunit [Massilia sp. REN29]
MQLVKKQEQASEVISHVVEPVDVDTDSGKFSRIGWLLVLLGFGGFVLWAFLAPLDKGVPMSGTVAAQSNRQAVQHLTGGTVQQLLVRDGAQVKEGQVVARMNPITAKSAVQLTEVQYLSALANVARLAAERDGAKTIKFPAEIEQRRNEPAVADLISSQNGLLLSRQNALQSQMSGVDESIAGLKMQIQGLQESRDSKKEQMTLLKEQLDGMRDLAKEGYVARNRLLELERTYAQLSGAVSEDIGNIGRSQRQVLELTLRRTQATQDYQKEVRTHMNDMQREADAQRARLTAEQFQLSNVDVRAPVAGTVVGLAVFTNGGVIPSGFKLMDIVPEGDPLVVEGQLPVNLVDKVYPGLKVELIFSAFNANKTPHIEGEVTTVAADRQVDERTGNPYYVVKVKVTPRGHQMMAEHKMDARPGMPVELFVKTGERTMMNYLFRPILDRMPAAMGGD